VPSGTPSSCAPADRDDVRDAICHASQEPVMATFDDHFAPQAGDYAAYRPAYPRSLIDTLAAHAPGRHRCWDVGTGSGQAAMQLAECFEHVEATDASASQIAHARPHPRITYRVAPAEQSGLADRSIDLVTVAQALHWFDLPAFYREVERVAVPGAMLAAWSYGMLSVDADVDAVVAWFYEPRLGQYWPEERRHVESGYTTLPFPFPRISVAVDPVEARLDRDRFVGYVSTWSALKRAREREAHDPLPEFVERLAAAWPDRTSERIVRWPMVLLAGRILGA
jgi:hypothetical protein